MLSTSEEPVNTVSPESPENSETDSVCNWAGSYRECGWGTIPLQAGTKRPPERFALKRYFTRPPEPAEVEAWFNSTESNVGIVLGAISDALCVRDFDADGSYDRWAADNPRLAAVLPTAVTGRPGGRHVYFTCDLSDISPSIIRCGDGELRSSGYAVCPPSTHPSGRQYEWLIPPDRDVPFISNLYRAGLLNTCSCNSGGGTQVILRDLNLPWEGHCGTVESLLTWAIESSMPTGWGMRNYRVFDLCRNLKAIPECRDCAAGELEGVVRRWWKLALPVIRTKDFSETWGDFVRAWGAVKYPKGMILASVFDRAGGEGIDRLRAACRLLQRDAGSNPFFLDGRSAANCLGVSHRSVARWLQRLVAGGVLRLVRRGRRIDGRASEYIYEGKKE